MREYWLQNREGVRLGLLDFGATLTTLTIPVNNGLRNVLLACEPCDYPHQQVYLGAIVGRFANRIANAAVSYQGQSWPLSANEGRTCLHGGRNGLHNRVWRVIAQQQDRIALHTQLKDGEEGFPGNLDVTVEYQLAHYDLLINLTATTDAVTPVNLTSHAYFNLDGGDVREHAIVIDADRYLPIDEQSIPIGIAPVEGVFDLRQQRNIGDNWLSHPQQISAHGFDHCFLLNKHHNAPAVTLTAADGQLTMEMYTNQPAVQFYTGNWLAGTPAKGGGLWENHQGLCLEAQQLPDSPNRPELGDPWLKPGEVYRHQTRYRFIPHQ